MHDSVLEFVAEMVAEHDLAARSVLEVGSYDVNGSVRHLFSGEYIGVDMREGPGVDQVALAASLPFGAESFDVVISTEMLEHDETPWLSVAEMARVTRDYVIVTARGYDNRGCFPVHDYPGDYWRFSPSGLRALFASAGLREAEVWTDPEAPGVFGTARKI